MFTSLRSRALWVCCAVTLAAAGSARADDAPAAPVPAASLYTTDLGDLWRLVRHQDMPDAAVTKKFFVVAPSIGSKPSTGLNGGFSGNIAFYRGDPRTTHISTVSGGIKLSQKKQTLAGFRFATFTDNDRWFFQGTNQLSWTSQSLYGLGANTLKSGATNVKYDLRRFYESAYRNVRPGFFIGVGLNISDHSDVRPGTSTTAAFDASAYASYNAKHGFAVDEQVSSGPSVGLLYDTRDNAINAQRGVLASANYRMFVSGFLGGDSTWQELYLDARTYRKLTGGGRNKLAFWFLGDLVTGGTAPYLDLPATAGQERSARGYGEGRYRGEQMLYGEMEYRGTLVPSGLVGVVAFVNTTTVDNKETGEKLFDAYAPGAGFGFRFLLNKRSKTNLCTDYGWGKAGSRGFYLAIQEAF